VRRRDFIKVIAVSVAWPLAASAQQREQVRRIGVLIRGRTSRARARGHSCKRHHERGGVASSQPYVTDRVRGSR
jgi:hypothetical protein